MAPVKARDSVSPVAAHPPGPQIGDVELSRESRYGLRYSLRQLPAAAQLNSGSREAALALAREFARLQRVNVWYRDDDRVLLMDVFRPPSGKPRIDGC